MNRTAEQEGGRIYAESRELVRIQGPELHLLAGYIEMAIKGTTQFAGPLWRVRDVPPEGKRIELDSFVDYLLLPAREGLGLESLHQLRSILESTDGGDKALVLLREEIPDFDKQADIAKLRFSSKRVGSLAQHGERGRGRAKDRHNNIMSIQGTSTDYTLARLKRGDKDEHRDRLYRDLVKRIMMGELSPNAAAIQAGFRKRMIQVPADDLEAAVAKLERHYGARLKVVDTDVQEA